MIINLTFHTGLDWCHYEWCRAPSRFWWIAGLTNKKIFSPTQISRVDVAHFDELHLVGPLSFDVPLLILVLEMCNSLWRSRWSCSPSSFTSIVSKGDLNASLSLESDPWWRSWGRCSPSLFTSFISRRSLNPDPLLAMFV